MIWCIIIAGLLVASIVTMVIGFIKDNVFGTIGIVSLILLVFVAIPIGIDVIPEHTNQGAKLAELEARKSSVEYQIENGLVIGDALAEFNGELAYKQELLKSPWTNWFVGDYIEEVEPINVK